MAKENFGENTIEIKEIEINIMMLEMAATNEIYYFNILPQSLYQM
jgi:hypothetical protein